MMHALGTRLFYESTVANFLGILELIAWVLSVVSLAAVVTYTVIRATQKIEQRREAAREPAPPTGT
jgi:hypothetical protein